METGSELFNSLRPAGEGVSTLGEGLGLFLAALRNKALQVTERLEGKETRIRIPCFLLAAQVVAYTTE